MSIQILSVDLRNKISAGEVVERPASVVKELVENSLDAGASEVSVVVEEGGQRLIQVRDDGCGIPPADLPRAFERYSTSKIATLDDLYAIETLGFRGEALASITSVSEITVASCIAGGSGGELDLSAAGVSEIRPAPDLPGTQVTVRNLFYNTPARRKFLKSPKTEFRKIVEMLRRFGLAWPEVAFHLTSDDRVILDLKPEPLADRIVSLLDPTYREQLLPVDFTRGDYNLTGFVGNLNLVRTRPGEQYIFLNRRFIRDRLLNSASYGAYRSLIKRGEYPFFVLNLRMPPEQVDVNVHPMKIEVRFKDEWRLFHALKSAVGEALRDILETIPNFGLLPAGASPGTGTPEVGPGPDPGEGQGSLPLRSASPENNLERARSYVSTLASRKAVPDNLDLENIWQVHSKYILSPVQSGLVIIDQHVAHERILFEEALQAFDSTPLAAQTLLFPEVLEFSPDEYSLLLELLPSLEKIGFRMVEFGPRTVLVEAVPSEMSWGNEKQIIREILDDYLENRSQYSSFQEALAASFACHAAIKAGDPLTVDEMQALVNRLFGTQHPYYCPHGRPIIVQLSLDELDQRFERK